MAAEETEASARHLQERLKAAHQDKKAFLTELDLQVDTFHRAIFLVYFLRRNGCFFLAEINRDQLHGMENYFVYSY